MTLVLRQVNVHMANREVRPAQGDGRVKDGAEDPSMGVYGAKVSQQGGRWIQRGNDDGESHLCCAQNPRFASTGSMSESLLWRVPF